MNYRTSHAHFSTHCARAVVVVMVGLFAVLLGRVAYLQTYGRETTIARADRQQHLLITLQARRGDIYDRNGLIMAGSIQTHDLFVDPKFMQDCFQEDGHSLVEMEQALDKLAAIIGQDSFDLAKLLGDRATSRFVKVAGKSGRFDGTADRRSGPSGRGDRIQQRAVLSDGIAGGARAWRVRDRRQRAWMDWN